MLLPKFQEFLLSSGFASRKHTPHYARWVHRFRMFSDKNRNISMDLRVAEFIEQLRHDPKIAEWQIDQAETALRIYLNNFAHSAEPADKIETKPVKNYYLDNDAIIDLPFLFIELL